jgi:CRP-like cAMP-binding protein
MAHANSQRNSSQNRLLAALPSERYETLLPKLTRVSLDIKEVLYDVDQPISEVYFPLSGVISLVSETGQDIVEVATVGNEGFVGLPVFLGSDRTTIKAFSQIPGESLKMKSADFKAELKRDGDLQELLQLYTQGLLNQMAQSAACNRVHSIEQRCARWLLMCADRVGGKDFSLTQEFLGQMLGVRRPQISKVASRLQKAGLIRYRRGQVTIIDREKLQAATCECYKIVQDEYSRLLGDGTK